MFFLQNYTLLRSQLKNIPRTFVMSLVYSYILHFSVISKRCVCVCVCVCACVHVHASSVMSDSAARQAPLSIEIFRQEYWSRLPFPPTDFSIPKDRAHISCFAVSAGGFLGQKGHIC